MTATLVVIPTYNERENLAAITARLLKSVDGVDVLVVDDNSPDGTGAIASALASSNDRIHVLHRAGKEGLGAAYRAGFAWGLERGYERFVEMDADGSHQPEQLTRLLERMDGGVGVSGVVAGVSAGPVDVVLGSRWVRGGAVENWPLRRSLLSRGGSLYARFALGLPYRDITGGFRVFSAQALRVLGYDAVLSQGYCFQIDMLWRAQLAGLRIAEVPITFVERVYGESKMSSGIVREAIGRVTLWGMRARFAGLWRQLLSFLLVGWVGLVVDITIFNALRGTVLEPHLVHGGPVIAKVISTVFAIGVNWFGNRFWTFRDARRSARRSDVIREGVEFAAVSLVGASIAIGCLWVSHYVLGLTTILDDNIATNVVGLGLGTAFRFTLYRWWVYSDRRRVSVPTSAAASDGQSSRSGARDLVMRGSLGS